VTPEEETKYIIKVLIKNTQVVIPYNIHRMHGYTDELADVGVEAAN
jgi:hypothetical protein